MKICSLHCQLAVSCLEASGFAMNRWHWNKGKTSQYNYNSRPTSTALPTHTWCLAANQQRSRCIRRAQCTATRSWHHSPWSSGSNSAWQSTLASFLDAALTWGRACLFRAALGSLHSAVRHSYQVYLAQNHLILQAHQWTFGQERAQMFGNACDMRKRLASCSPFSILLDLNCAHWSAA